MSLRIARADFKRGINYGDVPEVSSARPRNAMRHTWLCYTLLRFALRDTKRATFATSVHCELAKSLSIHSGKFRSCDFATSQGSDFFSTITTDRHIGHFQLVLSILITCLGGLLRVTIAQESCAIRKLLKDSLLSMMFLLVLQRRYYSRWRRQHLHRRT